MTSSAPYHNVGGGGGGQAPVIVQGYVVAGKDNSSANNNAQNHLHQQLTAFHDNNNSPERPQAQQRGCRDAFWAILFYAHLAFIVALVVLYAPQAIAASSNGTNRYLMTVRRLDEAVDSSNEDDGQQQDSLDIDVSSLPPLLGAAGILSVLLSSCALGFMMQFADILIKTALIFNIFVFIVSAVASLLVGAIGGTVMGFVFAAIATFYACTVWSRVPFAAANLVTAVTAVRANIGLAFYAYLSIIWLFGWTILWAVACYSTMVVVSNCDENGNCSNEISGIVNFLFLVSFYWTAQVITNVVHVTTAGTVGTFWFAPIEANGCCSSAVRESYIRSLTSSFGSICFGSLIVAIIQATKEMIRSVRDNGDSLIACCAECLLGCIESLVEYFNKWAYIYVGLYGFSFMEAGSNVMTLFRNRGWSVIIADMMVDTVLFMVSIGVGAITALLTTAIGYLMGNRDATTLVIAAAFGFIVGYAMSSTLFSVVSSAVNTVIVCYAEAPNEFQANHPKLSDQMRTAWRQAYPNEFGY